MTCYIYRETERTLIGPFPSPDEAFEHREMIRELNGKRLGRPRHVGAIISTEEAIKLCTRQGIQRLIPDQDATIARMEFDKVA